MKDVLLSGCTASEYSYDALIGGKYHGAMTYFAIQAIREANYDLTYSQLRSRLLYLLTKQGIRSTRSLKATRPTKRSAFSVEIEGASLRRLAYICGRRTCFGQFS